ncbi:MAG: polyprenyl synthetase family protein [Sulfobacillus thermosulfidooxidans]|uniref:Polyprenyl synthetase family protein n=1 Tax=Sulfobacillus thermosulfidooxidans TaxID=28034 RepID=A0A2T2WP58_SULTH|nr:MAG: polyprenyl synthetase family protein [Sulfobacillus thermosulfidooxidans]
MIPKYSGLIDTASATAHDETRSAISQVLWSILEAILDDRTDRAIFQPTAFALQTPGKLLRALILLDSCSAVGGDPNTIIFAAVGLEAGHLASLIHDDIIDQDTMRRGTQSLWARFGLDQAIITGDFFIFVAFYSLALCRHQVSPYRVARVVEQLSKAGLQLCIGQSEESRFHKNLLVTLDDYLEMIRFKTASLFRVAAESGAILGGGTRQDVNALGNFSESLGLAFQILDDMAPYLLTDAQSGKSHISDIINGRVTLPIIVAMRDGTETQQQLLSSIFNHDRLDPVQKHAEIKLLLEQTGSLDSAHQMVQHLLQCALDSLSHLPMSSSRTQLETIVYRLSQFKGVTP